jgi:hypothetical protein
MFCRARNTYGECKPQPFRNSAKLVSQRGTARRRDLSGQSSQSPESPTCD